MYDKMNKKEIAKNDYRFKLVYDSMPANIRVAFRLDMQEAMSVASRTTFYSRMTKGLPEPTVSEFEAMKSVFNKYNITKCFDHELD